MTMSNDRTIHPEDQPLPLIGGSSQVSSRPAVENAIGQNARSTFGPVGRSMALATHIPGPIPFIVRWG